MDYDQLFPGRFLKSGELNGKDVTLTIDSIKLEEMEDQKGKRMKPIIAFRERKKEWVLNRTNAECLKAMWGRDTNDWLGKRVTLWPAPYTDMMTGEEGTALRVRGSPDIGEDMSFELRLPRKKPANMKLRKTPTKVAAKPAPVPEPVEEEEVA
jgi:hypothetical protein